MDQTPLVGKNEQNVAFCWSHLAHLEPEVQQREVDDNGIGRDDDDVAPSSTKFQTALTWFLHKLKRYHKKGKSSQYNFRDDGNISLAPAVHV